MVGARNRNSVCVVLHTYHVQAELAKFRTYAAIPGTQIENPVRMER